MGVFIYIIIGTVLGYLFSLKSNSHGGLYIYIIVGIVAATIGGTFSISLISANYMISGIVSIIFDCITLHIFTLLINKTQ
jgi:uncharacterized membrane protein YeaQ/YmgE (transglycosylase-associated protein family)